MKFLARIAVYLAAVLASASFPGRANAAGWAKGIASFDGATAPATHVTSTVTTATR